METKVKNKGTGCLGCAMIAIPVVLILLVAAIIAWTSYNGMVTKEESVKGQWGQVENTYQRRADLIDNLVATVKGYASHEKSTLTDVIEARSKATAVNINVDNLNETTVQNFEQAQNGLSSAFSKLMVVMEKYPDLKANQGFLELQAQLEEIENTILIERRTYNSVAQEYNTYIRKFPKNLFASLFGFDIKGYFQAKEGADEVPKVQF